MYSLIATRPADEARFRRGQPQVLGAHPDLARADWGDRERRRRAPIGSTFIRGLPMNCATKRLPGRS